MSTRKVTKNNEGRPVVSNLRLPDEHYQPGDVADVTMDGAVVTIRPAVARLVRPAIVCADGCRRQTIGVCDCGGAR